MLLAAVCIILCYYYRLLVYNASSADREVLANLKLSNSVLSVMHIADYVCVWAQLMVCWCALSSVKVAVVGTMRTDGLLTFTLVLLVVCVKWREVWIRSEKNLFYF